MPPPESSPEPQLSLVVPVYNEARVLPESVPAMAAQAEELGLAYELLLVDDGSSDDSAAVIASLAAERPEVRPLAHERNRGKGAAVRTGCLQARGAKVVFLDADLSVPLHELAPLLDALEQNDVVLGSRRLAGSNIARHQPWLREQLGRGFTGITRLLLAPEVRDFTCGFKGFRREAARTVFERSALNGWAFDAELVTIARVQGLRLSQIPVEWRHDDDTKVRLGAAVLGSLWDLLRILGRRARGLYR